jgi:hypothetical protein
VRMCNVLSSPYHISQSLSTLLLHCVLSSHTYSPKLKWHSPARNWWPPARYPQQQSVPFILDDDLETRTKVALDENVHDQSDMAALYQQKLAIEGASPKPCIVPGNALQLINDNPTTSRSHTASSVIILDYNEGNCREICLDSSADQAKAEISSRPYPVFASL